MVRRINSSVFTLFAFVSTAQAQVAAQLTPESITEALSAETPGCYQLAPAIGCFTTPYSRVVGKAQAQRRLYNELARTDITNDLIAPGELHVYAMAHEAAAGGVASVEAVVILPRGSDPGQILRPSRTFEATAEFKNLMGASFQGKSLVAVFPLSALKESNEAHIVFDRPVQAFKIAPPGYKTRPGDVLEITVFGHEDLGARPTVDSEGNIALPLLDRVGVAGLLEDEIRAKIEKLLGKDYLVQPEVAVRITPVPCDECSAQFDLGSVAELLPAESGKSHLTFASAAPALAQTAAIPKQPSARPVSQPLASEAGHVTGKWKFDKRVDKMTDAELLTLTVRSEEGRASLRLVCSPGADGNPMLHFLLVVPEDPKREYTLVSLRFDKKEQEFDLANKVEEQILLRAIGGITGAVNYWLQTNDPSVVGTAIGSGSSSAISKDVIQANSHRLLDELTNASRLLYQFSLVSDVPGTEGTFDVRAFSEAFKPMAEKGCGHSADQKQ